MAKRVTSKERLFYRKVETRLNKGWTWQMIADDLVEPLETVYSRYHRVSARILRETSTKHEVVA